MQFEILEKTPLRIFVFCQCRYIGFCILGISEDLKQETLLNVNGLLPLRRYSFFHTPKYDNIHDLSSGKFWEGISVYAKLNLKNKVKVKV